MIAILISEENRDKLALTGCFFDRSEDLDTMLETPEKEYYFMPVKVDYDFQEEQFRNDWVKYPRDLFDKIYHYDHEQIKTNFVTITRKDSAR